MVRFRNIRNGKFERIGAAPGSGLALALTARGLAVGDLDGDGRLDVVMNNIDSGPAVLRNTASPAGNWLAVRLVADTLKKNPRGAIGARVYVTTGKTRQRRDVVSGTSYASQNDLAVHFGLGPATSIDKLEIKWPDGSLQTVRVPGVNRRITVVQNKGIAGFAQK
jgi:enediyne biosynthesis protein E4